MQGQQLVRNDRINGAHQRAVLRLVKDNRHTHPQELGGHGVRLGEEGMMLKKCACDEITNCPTEPKVG